MELDKTSLNGVFLIKINSFTDHRGSFNKLFHSPSFDNLGLATNFKEVVYSTSIKNVVRGMHFQIPPDDHAKFVWVSYGSILDVALCVDRDSKEFGRYISQILTYNNGLGIYISKGYAHGFRTLSDIAIVNYITTTVHSPENDMAIRWDSFNMNWGINNPILSEKDITAIGLKEWGDMK